VILRQLRIGFLLLILVVVALGAWLSRVQSTDWNDALWVAIYPINADGSAASQEYIGTLSDDTFEAIETFMLREAQRYDVALDEAVRVEVYHEVRELPPPFERNANILERMLWSLRMRWWASSASENDERAPPDIRMFVLYHDPDISPQVPHSLGLREGLMGVVHAFAAHEMTGANNIVIAHEFLHTLGASDKYDLETDAPVFPHGYADPEQEPLHPQERAEVMAGRRALTEREWEMPETLRSVVIGPLTAREINWMDEP
jgi:hypothetical protein